MDDEPRYGIARGLMLSLCVLLVCGGIYRSVDVSQQVSLQGAAAPAGYQRRFCDDRKTLDYSDQNPDRISIPLREGCYGDRVILPKSWQSCNSNYPQTPETI